MTAVTLSPAHQVDMKADSSVTNIKDSLTKKIANFVKTIFTTLSNIFIYIFHKVTMNFFKPLTDDERIVKLIKLFSKNIDAVNEDDCAFMFSKLTDSEKREIAIKAIEDGQPNVKVRKVIAGGQTNTIIGLFKKIGDLMHRGISEVLVVEALIHIQERQPMIAKPYIAALMKEKQAVKS